MVEWREKEADRQAALAEAGGRDLEAEDAAQQQQQFKAYVPLPDEKEIEQRVMQKKKAELLAKYTSESLMQQQQESRQLLNKR